MNDRKTIIIQISVDRSLNLVSKLILFMYATKCFCFSNLDTLMYSVKERRRCENICIRCITVSGNVVPIGF